MRYILLALFLITSAIYGQQIIKDLTVQDLKVVSTTKGSKPCPLMTQTQINAIASPLNGQCVYNTTTNKLNVYNGSLWKAAGGGVDSWATATVYAVNDLVIESNKIYKCLTAHTSGTFATDLAASRWIEVSAGVSSHLDLTDIGTNTHAQIDSHIANTSNPHSVTKAQIGLSNVVNADTTTTANITDSLNKRFVTDAEKTVIGNTSGTNTGDQDLSGLITLSTNQTITGLKQFNNSVGIGGAANANAVLDVQSTTKAFLPPRMTTAQMNAIALPVAGMTVYNTDFKSVASYDGTKWVYGFGFLNLDNTFSAKITTNVATPATDLNVAGWISGCTNANPTVCNLTGFTVTPNCTFGASGGAVLGNITALSSTSISIATLNSTTGANANGSSVQVNCQKRGADYLSASSNAYASTNSNYSRTAYTPTFTGFGTVSASSCFHSKDGEFLEIDCKFTSGSPTATEARVSLPSGLTSSSSGELRVAGEYVYDTNSTSHGGIIIIEPNVGYVTFSRPEVYSGSTIGALTKANANNILGSGTIVSLKARIPIQGWSNAPFIVGSFQGYNSTPGTNNSKIFSATITTTTGAVTNNKGGIITTCTAANPTVCTFSGLIETPRCSLSQLTSTNQMAVRQAVSSSSITVATRDSSTAVLVASQTFDIICHGE